MMFSIRPVVAGLVSGLLLSAAAAPSASAEPGSLEGSWSGGGRVTFPSGESETARCRAHYSRQSKTSYVVRASCATASARVEQTARVRQSGANTFTGSFHNDEYNVDGEIRVTVSGATQSVSLDGGGATAKLRLSR